MASESEEHVAGDDGFSSDNDDVEDERVAHKRDQLIAHLQKRGIEIDDGMRDMFYDLVVDQNAATQAAAQAAAAAAAAAQQSAACHKQAKDIAAERAATSNLYALVHLFENELQPYIVRKHGHDWIGRLA